MNVPPDPGGLSFLGAGLRFGLRLLRKALLRGLHVLHFREHDVGGVLQLKRCLLQLLGAFREAGLIFHIFVFVKPDKFDRPRFLPHGILVAALSCGRWVRGGEPNEDETHAAKPRAKDTQKRSGVP